MRAFFASLVTSLLGGLRAIGRGLNSGFDYTMSAITWPWRLIGVDPNFVDVAFTPLLWPMAAAGVGVRHVGRGINAAARSPKVHAAARSAARGIGRGALGIGAHALRTADAVIGLPARILGGGGGHAPVQRPHPEQFANEVEHAAAKMSPAGEAKLRAHSDSHTAKVIWRSARARIQGRALADREAKELIALTPQLRGWLASLDSQELERVANAGISRVAAHMRGSRPINGVPGVNDVVSARRATEVDEDLDFDFAGPAFA